MRNLAVGNLAKVRCLVRVR